MADLTKSAGALLEEVRATVSSELLAALRPLIRKMTEAAMDLENALGSGSSAPAKRSPGRPKGTGKKKAGAPKGAGKRGPRSTNPRGALKAAIIEVLQASKGGAKLSQLRDRLMQNNMFSDRNRVGLYNQIAGALKTIPGISKGSNKAYSLKGGAEKAAAPAAGKTGRKPGRPRKNA